jgi:multidrug transporter EmrE-like cation transporter
MVVPMLASSAAFGIGGVFMKPSAGLTRLFPSLAVIFFFLVGALFLTVAVSKGSISTVIVVGLGFEALFSVGFGIWVLGERLSIHQALGIALILCGVLVMRSQ